MKYHSTEFYIEKMDCPDELRLIEAKLKPLAGIEDLRPNYIQRTLTIVHEESLPVEKLRQAIRSSGFEAALRGEEHGEIRWWPRYGKGLLTIASGLMLAAALALHIAGGYEEPAVALAIGSLLTGGAYVLQRGIASAFRFSFEMNFLMSVAAIGAVIVGEPYEGASVMFLFSVAQWLESRSIDRARDAIRKLLDLAPREAVVVRDGAEMRVPVGDVAVGETLIIRPAEKIPLDGVVIGGASSVNESPVTGESLPVEKTAGSSVFAGSLNVHGSLTVAATSKAENTTLAKIIHLVEEAQSRRAPSQQFVDRFARIYTPAVLVGALLVAAIPPILGHSLSDWVYQALVLLVIACPCALVISTPVTIVCALARSARDGVLIKGGAHLEHLGRLQTIIFDKTGTLTWGKPEVADVVPLADAAPDEILAIAAAVESRSEHPLAHAILRKAISRKIETPAIANFAALPGLGARADIDGTTFYVGRPRLFQELGCPVEQLEETVGHYEGSGRISVFVGTQCSISGAIILSDTIRPNAAGALARLRDLGVDDLVMLTGDNEGSAKAVADKLSISHYHAGLLPADKVREVQMVIQQQRLAAMVGDGINDAPALAASTVGIAMGTAGTDAALETADVALMTDDLERIPYAVSLGRRTERIIRQNIAASLLIKAAFIGLVVAGRATLWAAVAADVGVTLLVVFNAMRMLNHSPEPSAQFELPRKPTDAQAV